MDPDLSDSRLQWLDIVKLCLDGFENSVLRSQVFGQPLKESCVVLVCKSKLIFIDCKALLAKTKTYKAYSK